ncbi:MAG: hypothetical protein WAM70_04770 [Pyrinomonadaceae bacterium]
MGEAIAKLHASESGPTEGLNQPPSLPLLREGCVSTKDHNETLVGIHLVIGSVFALVLIGAPWIIGENFREAKQIQFWIVLFGTVLLVTLLMFSTAIAMRRQKPIGRKLGLFAAGVLIVLFWPAGVYSWWFFHSAGAKKMYGVQRE